MKKESKLTSNTIYCFSPPVMLFTFILEIFSALFILINSKLKKSNTITIAILICLAIFQIAEYHQCAINYSLIWMRIGYVAITLLPPLGVHLVTQVTKKRWLAVLGYSLALIFVITFLVSTESLKSAICGGNYVMVATGGNFASLYFPLYYYLLLAIGLLDIGTYTLHIPHEAKKNTPEQSYLWWIAFGYISFLVPTGAVYLISDSARAGIPSIMCGFAILLAIILTFKVYPMQKEIKDLN